MASRRIHSAAGAAFLGLALSLTLLHSGGAAASGDASARATVEPTSKKKKAGPPPGTTTKQIQGWVDDALKGWNSSCTPKAAYPCTLTIKWSNIRWMGTTKICIKGNFGQPCLEYGTAYVARASILLTTATQQFDFQNNPTYISTNKSRHGYWEGGRKEVTYKPWPDGPTWKAACSDCGKDLYVRKGEFGRWFWGFGGTPYYLR
jgi:hypothetical protein